MHKKILILAVVSIFPFLSGCNNENGNTTNNENVEVSNNETFVIDNKLVAPRLSLKGNVLSWNNNLCADYYTIYINDKYTAVTYDTFYNLEDRINGDFDIKIRAYDSYLRYKESDFSNEVTYVVKKKTLAIPGVYVDGDVLIWPDVKGATSYKVYLNGGWQHTWKITNSNHINKCKMNFSDTGTYKVNVVAYSDDMTYEKEKSSPIIKYKISLDKNWNPANILSNWEVNGEYKLNEKVLVINPDKKDVETHFKNNLIIEDKHNFLYLRFDENTMPKADELMISASGISLSPVVNKSINIPDNVMLYDLTYFTGLAINLDVGFKRNLSFNLENIRLFTENNRSLMDKWVGNQVTQDWTVEGKAEIHPEGFCLEVIGQNKSSITNEFILKDYSRMSFLLRKFERPGDVQDADPVVYVYVNNQIIKPIGSEVNYATVSSDAYELFNYDLSAYLNQDVEIKIESIVGEHACFGSIDLIA